MGSRPGRGDLPKKARSISKLYSPSTLLREVEALLAQPSGPIIVEAQKPREPSGAPILPVALKIDQPHTGNGIDGGLAQPLQEPENLGFIDSAYLRLHRHAGLEPF